MRKAMLCLVALLGMGGAASAHHPFADDFDRTKPVTLTGTVTKIEWTNPHVYAYVNVKDDPNKGNWKIEMGSPAALSKEGWTAKSLKSGDTVTIEGWRAKNGARFMNAKSFTMPDGKTASAASSFDDSSASDTLAQNADTDQQAVGTGTGGGNLPGTASPLPLVGLFSLLSLAGAAGLRFFR
jgi:hypothetical protein